MPYLVDAELLENREVGQNSFLLVFRAPQIASGTRPGQFVMAAPKSRQVVPSPLLKRALAVYSLPEDGAVSILVKTVGEGTARLASMKSGQRANLIGPLGNGFGMDAGRGKVNFIVAGGVGIASVYLLARTLKQRGDEVHLLYGGRTAADLVMLEDFQDLGIPAFLATDDGSAGFRGFVTQGVAAYMKDFRTEDLVFYACGPEPMLKAVSMIACRAGIRCQVSVEARMACGFGVCLGCSVKTRQSYKLACSDGPVFEASELVWEGN